MLSRDGKVIMIGFVDEAAAFAQHVELFAASAAGLRKVETTGAR